MVTLLTFLAMFVHAQVKPFGMVRVDENIFFDETEINVGSWLSYYSWVLSHGGFEVAQKTLPDSSAIEPELWAYIKRKSTDYLDKQGTFTLQPIGYFAKECKECSRFGKRLPSERRYCAMLDFPITGLTYEQVNGFCEWRTKIEGSNKLVFLLPTPEEWKYFALKGLSEQERRNGFRDSLNNKNCPQYNFNITCNCGNDDYEGKLNGIAMFSPEKTGAFDVFGNVSEMTSTKGVAKGGNFELYAKQCHPDSIQHYDSPEIWLGFRCIAVKNVNKSLQSSIHKNVVQERDIIVDDSVYKDKSNGKFGEFTDKRDGRTYKTVRIGKQTWLAENLAYKPDSGKYWAWDNEERYVFQNGYLYNWNTAKNVCPVGWHLPSKEEFENLLQNVGGIETNKAYNELIPSGGSGYSIVFAGLHLGIDYTPNGLGACFWSSSDDSKRIAWSLGVGSNNQTAGVRATFSKKSGLSIRCIQDN